MKGITIDGTKLDIDKVYAVATNEKIKVSLSSKARKLCKKNRQTVEKMLKKGVPLYGINTGFGDLAHVSIDSKDLERLQNNLIRSHAVGVGAPFPKEIVRAALLLRANTLARGVSGIRPRLIDALLDLLNNDIIPVIPEKGSLGASGDLAPLAHLSLVLMGEGKAFVGKRLMSGASALKKAKLEKLQLQAKEGLALINGTPVMSAIGAICLVKARNLLRSASTIAALSIEALRGTDAAFDERIHRYRPHPGQIEVARHLRQTLKNSPIGKSHSKCQKVQDAYSLRCTPQVLGASIDAWTHTRKVIETELNSVTDNPLVFDDGILSGGNFHGEPVGLVLDYLSMAMAEVGSISERRCFRLLTTSLSDLPAFLMEESGVNSGYMICQYTAAALVSENKILCHPATVDSIPSSADQEDHVSMATTASRKTLAIIDNLTHILAIEYLTAVQALDLLLPLKSAKGTNAARRLLRKQVSFAKEDRWFAPDMEKAAEIVLSGKIDEVSCKASKFSWKLL